MDVLLPSSATELLLGFLAWLTVTVGAVVSVAVDLRRRDVAAWWVASARTLVMLPLGLMAYGVLRVCPGHPLSRAVVRRIAG